MFDMPSAALILLITGLGSLPPYPAPIASARTGTVREVTADLQLRVDAGPGLRSLRLAGLAVPDDPSGQAASRAAIRDLTRGEGIRWQPHGENAVLAFREPDGMCLNLEIIRQGIVPAEAAAARALPALSAYEAHARGRRVGRWADAEPGEQAGGMVYVTRTGTRYHRADCPHVRESGRPMPLAEAGTRYKACHRCKPATPRLSTELSTGTEPADENP